MEITQFLGRQARLISTDDGCPIHIIMERSTAKTMDCYVEFQTQGDAKDAVYRANKMQETGRIPKLGNRHINVELSNQDALLRDLFPRAKCVVWRDGVPYVMPNTESWSTGFTGFLTGEEVVGAIRHAEVPNRVSMSSLSRRVTMTVTVDVLSPLSAPSAPSVHMRAPSVLSRRYDSPWTGCLLFSPCHTLTVLVSMVCY